MAVDPVCGGFNEWLAEARNAGVPLPEAMTLATADASGRPSARMLLLKGADESGFTFFTGYESRKGRELEENPRAAIVVYWNALGRQVRVEGPVRRLSAEESDAYFETRPPRSRAAAAASRQSEPIASREELEAEFERLLAEHGDAVPRPGALGRLCARARGDRALAAPRRPVARSLQVHARGRRLAPRAPLALTSTRVEVRDAAAISRTAPRAGQRLPRK